jgi:hypothetical protein
MSIPRKSLATLIGVAGILVVTAVFASGAMAMPPTSSQHTASGSTTLAAGTLCSFPIQFYGTQTWTSTKFYDQNGLLVTDTARGTEQDTFSANGKTLQGNPYEFNVVNHFVNGVFVNGTAAGVAELVPLPGGGVFIAAGRVNIYPDTPAPIFTVDSGNSGNNLAAFCAALS